jgi:DnaJ homolog subfamily C member 3
MLIRLSALALAASILQSPALAAVDPKEIPSDTPVSSLLSSAQQHLSRGETHDALAYYDAAVARDPSDYLTYFKRATTYLSLGKTTQAAQDFNKVLLLKPGFEGAHLQLGRLKAKTADWDGAREQYQLASKGQESSELTELAEAQGGAVLAAEAEREGKWEECVSHASVAIMVANRAPSLREMRAHCRFERGELEEGMGDLRHILQMKPGDTSPYLKMSATTFYALGDLEGGMAQARKCLQSDPDSKECKQMLKQEKVADKSLAKVLKALDKGQPVTAVKTLVASEDKAGLIDEVKEQDRLLRESGAIPRAGAQTLVSRLVGLACQAYYEVSLSPCSYHGVLRAMTDALRFQSPVK